MSHSCVYLKYAKLRIPIITIKFKASVICVLPSRYFALMHEPGGLENNRDCNQRTVSEKINIQPYYGR